MDHNMNGEQDSDEPNLSGIPISLINNEQKEAIQTFSNYDGQFIFYQLAPGLYRFSIDDNLLPDNIQAPVGIDSITVDSTNLKKATSVKIGLIPFERLIKIVKEETKLTLTLEQEIVKPGVIPALNIESRLTLKSLELILPTRERVPLATSSNNVLNYHWQVPANILTSQVKIGCKGMPRR